jgi:hypothetical protein
MVPLRGIQDAIVPSVFALVSNIKMAVLKKVAIVIKPIIAAVYSVSV